MVFTNSSSRLWILCCFLALCCYTEGRPSTWDNTFYSILNRTTDTFSNIYDPIANRTKYLAGDISNQIEGIFHKNNDHSVNAANGTKFDIDNNSTNSVYSKQDVDKIKNCTIVIGGALAGAGVGCLTVGIALPLALCLLGFTCWGIMAGSAAACCQSSIGDVPGGSCFASCQSLGAGGGKIYLIIALIVGFPIGMYVGGLIAETHFRCFGSP